MPIPATHFRTSIRILSNPITFLIFIFLNVLFNHLDSSYKPIVIYAAKLNTHSRQHNSLYQSKPITKCHDSSCSYTYMVTATFKCLAWTDTLFNFHWLKTIWHVQSKLQKAMADHFRKILASLLNWEFEIEYELNNLD